MCKDYASMSCVSQVSVKYMMAEGKQRGWLELIDLMGELCEWVELVCSVNIAFVKLGVVGCIGDLLMQMSMKNSEVIVRAVVCHLTGVA